MTAPPTKSGPQANRRRIGIALGAVVAAVVALGGGAVYWLIGPRPDGGTAPSPPQTSRRKAAEPVAGPAWFRDVTAGSGLDFTYRNGEEADQFTILESLGGGVALLDYDGDGLLDLFFTGGGAFTGPEHRDIKGHSARLYRNLGGWKFQDVTAEAGLDRPLFYSHGCAVADFDRDGWPDLLVTGYGRLVLYH